MATFELTTTVPVNLVDGDILTCAYSGAYMQTTLPAGKYIFECYGAQGGGSSSTSTNGGKGGYSKGTIELQEETVAYLYVGGAGIGGGGAGGFNGGGAASNAHTYGGGGGGGTDIRLGGTSTGSRVIVAGGGGGASYVKGSSAAGGNGGGTSGSVGGIKITGDIDYTAARGGSQSAGGQGAFVGTDSRNGGNGSLYNGGAGGTVSSSTASGSGGGGGGYYGGGGGAAIYVASARYGASGGAGGSGYISSLFTDTTSSTGTRSGNGFIQITIVEIKKSPTTSIYRKINGSWVKGSKLFHKMNGEWKEILSLSLKQNGEWVGGASSSSSTGELYPIFNLGNTSLLRGSIADCSSGESDLKGYTISGTYGIEAYSGEALGNSGSGGITLMPIGWVSTGACNITINDISKSGRLYIGAYGKNNNNVVNNTNIKLVVKNNSSIVASYDLTYITASRMHTIEISNPGTISIELSAYGEYVVESIHGFITHISYQAID